MIINSGILKKFINVDTGAENLKELLASIGIEVAGISKYKEETIFEVEITPNRPDWLSHYGIAREIYAKERSLKFNSELPAGPDSISSGEFSVLIDNKSDCARYSGAIVRNVIVGESGPEVKELLESLGMRPVNSLVDISNLILMIYGHPTHIFDLDKINGNEIITRLAKKGERLKLLDGAEKELFDSDLVIADIDSPVALAGVMGGESSGVSINTKNIVIESAWFNPSRVRRTARRHRIKTDASYLFERGADIGITKKIVTLVLEMIRSGQDKKIIVSDVFDEFPGGFEKQKVVMEDGFPSRFTGIDIPREDSIQILNNLGFETREGENHIEVTVPSFRVDINGKEDLVEEIIRIYGYEKLVSDIPETINRGVFDDSLRKSIAMIGSHLQSRGFTEVINYSFHSSGRNLAFEGDTGSVILKNPIGSEYSTMRNSLLPGLMTNSSLNLNNGFKGVNLMEIGKIFYISKGELIEKFKLGLSTCGEIIPANWKNSSPTLSDLFTFKSEIELLLKRLDPGFEISYKQIEKEYIEEGTGFSIIYNGKTSGFFGKVSMELALEYGIEKEIIYAEFDLTNLLENFSDSEFKQWNRFPSVIRDLSFIIDKATSYLEIEDFIKSENFKFLEEFTLAEIYEGKKIENNRKSMLISFRFRGDEMTLKGEEVNDIFGNVVDKLKKRFGITIR